MAPARRVRYGYFLLGHVACDFLTCSSFVSPAACTGRRIIFLPCCYTSFAIFVLMQDFNHSYNKHACFVQKPFKVLTFRSVTWKMQIYAHFGTMIWALPCTSATCCDHANQLIEGARRRMCPCAYHLVVILLIYGNLRRRKNCTKTRKVAASFRKKTSFPIYLFNSEQKKEERDLAS